MEELPMAIEVYDLMVKAWIVLLRLIMDCIALRLRVQENLQRWKFFLGVIIFFSFYGDGASLWTCSSWIYKKSHLRVWMLKFW